ncbi:hypothetical protein ACF3NR_02625 [Vaginella massiliensis]|uniref:hypothetical protein n=1 Tax=Vaginella massiliensis TaxID=1816680 RepID=UPI000ABF8613|nr:hypothetical protein [Vaginella massiliensis]
MNQDQWVKMNGYIRNGSSFYGDYDNVQKQLTKDFLTFEHTDGLNYVNLEVRRFDNLLYFPISKNKKGIAVNLTEEFGAGFLYPKTNTQLMR